MKKAYTVLVDGNVDRFRTRGSVVQLSDQQAKYLLLAGQIGSPADLKKIIDAEKRAKRAQSAAPAPKTPPEPETAALEAPTQKE